MKKHFFFDLDNTLTPSRQKMEAGMRELLAGRSEDMVVISGAKQTQIMFQLDGIRMHTLAQNGNDAYDINGERLWQNELTTHEKETILAHMSQLREIFKDIPVADESNLIEDRICQMSYSVLGHHADKDAKNSFDPDASKRKDALARVPFISDTLEVSIGGTTTFDYYQKGMHKGKNVTRFLAHMGWNPDDAIYFGDRLHPGGNDSSVVGIIETVAVTDSEDTYHKLKNILRI